MGFVLKAIRSGGVAVPAMLALWMAGCTALPSDLSQVRTKFDTSQFFVPDPTQFAPKQESSRPITQADLVDGSGMCADMSPLPAATPAAAPPPAGDNASDPTVQAALPSLSGRNVALQMSECEVVRIMGRPGDIQSSANERGDRVVTMTYMTPERPVYKFVAGRLATIERTAEPPPPEAAKKKPAPKKKRQAA